MKIQTIPARYNEKGEPITPTVIVHFWARWGNEKNNMTVRVARGGDYAGAARRYVVATYGEPDEFFLTSPIQAPTSAQRRNVPLAE